MKDNKHIESILNSLNKMSRAELSPFVKSRMIRSILSKEKHMEIDISFKSAYWIMSFSALLLFMNIIILQNKKEIQVQQSHQAYTKDNLNEYYFNSTTIFYNDDK